MPHYPSYHQSGFTLAELMIASTLSMFIVLSVTSLVISTKLTQATQHNASSVQDISRFVLDNLNRSIKQAGYVNFDRDDTSEVPPFNAGSHTENHTMPSGVVGLHAGNLKSHGVDFSIPKTALANDILAIHYSGAHHLADGATLGCSGLVVIPDALQNRADQDHAWSIYYVATDTSNNSSLFCKYKNPSKDFAAQAIANGVTSFHILYAVEINSERQYLNAKQIDALDANIQASDLNQDTHWKKISALKVTMLLHETDNAYPGAASNSRQRTVTSTIQLRNSLH